MYNEETISRHYSPGDLLKSIEAGIRQMGKASDTVTIDDFAPVDEFHIGGRQATKHLAAQLGLSSDAHLIDIGCGLGGAARYVADKYGCRVTGIDLTDEYVKTGQAINQWVGLDQQIDLHQGSALNLPFDPGIFDGGYMIHVGMNIPDKSLLFAGIHPILRTGTLFGVYDVMKVAEGEVTYPVPWADVESMSALATPHDYEAALSNAGFEIVAVNDRRDDALEFFEVLRSKSAAGGAPPPLSLQQLMGASSPAKVKNMIDNLVAGLISPVEIIVRKV